MKYDQYLEKKKLGGVKPKKKQRKRMKQTMLEEKMHYIYICSDIQSSTRFRVISMIQSL